LTLGVFYVESLVRTLQRGDRPTKLARALQELGRIIKSLFLLQYINDESYRRRILVQLNRGEGRHSVARALFYGQRDEVRQRYREGQEDQLNTLGNVSTPRTSLAHLAIGASCSLSVGSFVTSLATISLCFASVTTWTF